MMPAKYHFPQFSGCERWEAVHGDMGGYDVAVALVGRDLLAPEEFDGLTRHRIEALGPRWSETNNAVTSLTAEAAATTRAPSRASPPKSSTCASRRRLRPD